MSADTAEPERLWRLAHDKLDGTPETDAAEQAAWNAYAQACRAISECLIPGCDTKCSDYPYCAEHRERPEGWAIQ